MSNYDKSVDRLFLTSSVGAVLQESSWSYGCCWFI